MHKDYGFTGPDSNTHCFYAVCAILHLHTFIIGRSVDSFYQISGRQEDLQVTYITPIIHVSNKMLDFVIQLGLFLLFVSEGDVGLHDTQAHVFIHRLEL